MVSVELLGGVCDGERMFVYGEPPTVQKVELRSSVVNFVDDVDVPMKIPTSVLTYVKSDREHPDGLTYYQLNQ